MPRKPTISKVQIQVLKTLKEGGKMFKYNTGDSFLDDKDDNTLELRPQTFDLLKEKELIKITSRPAIGTFIYGLSQKGIQELRKHKSA